MRVPTILRVINIELHQFRVVVVYSTLPTG
jgi:hypothetical protein